MAIERSVSLKTRDIVFLAIVAAAVTLAGFVTIPLVLAIPIPGVRSVPAAVFYGLFLALGALKVHKPGSIFVIAALNGLVLLMMSWIMFLNNVIAALVVELIVWLSFRGYHKDSAVLLGAGLYMPLTIPANLLVAVFIGGEYLGKYLTMPWLVALMLLATAALSFLGAWAGIRIGRELTKAGILKAA
jgi:energy-coupling factor transport system substrate-specific component